LGLGLEIVSMDIPEIRKYANDIRLVDNSDAFISEIEKALEEQLTEKRKKELRDIVNNDSWDVRVQEILQDIKELLKCVE